MKALLGFITRNKVFVIVVAAGLLVVGAIVAVPAIQNASAEAKAAEVIEDAPEAPTEREIEDAPIIAEPEEETPDPVETPAEPELSDKDRAEADRLAAEFDKPYQNDGEYSFKAAQAYLGGGNPNPVDDNGDPIIWFGTVMMDPDPVAAEFAKQWANPAGGKDAWLERLRPIISDGAYYNLGFLEEEDIFDLTVTDVSLEKDPALLASGFYRYMISYEGCGETTMGSMVPHPEGSWMIDVITEAQESSPATRGGPCFK